MAVFAFVTLLVNAVFAGHFTVRDTATGNTLSTIICTGIHPTLNGLPLNRNDEIGVFDAAGNCFGAGLWDSIHNINVITYGNDQYLSGKHGFYNGDTVKFVIWDTVTLQEVAAKAAIAGGNAILYSQNGIYVLTGLTATTPPVTLALPLQNGWSLVSLNVNPADSGVAAVFGGTSGSASQNPSGQFLLVKDLQGDLYWPLYGINAIDTIHTGQGYMVYSDSADTIIAQGSPVNVAAAAISLCSGWNMIGYLPRQSGPIAAELAGIGSNVYIVKNAAGAVYWPEYGIDDIDTMKPGSGYLVDMLEPGTLTYPTGVAKTAAAGKPCFSLPPVHHYPIHFNTGSSGTVLAKSVTFGGAIVADESEIGVFNSKGNCVGSGAVVHGLTAFPVWGTDPMAKQKNGCADGEPLTFKLWVSGNEVPLDYRSGNGASATFAVNGIIAGTFAAPAVAGCAGIDFPKAYPNPFRGAVTISFDVPASLNGGKLDLEINAYDATGRLVRQLARGGYREGHYTLSWTPSGDRQSMAGSEAYFIRMKGAGFEKQLKVVEVK